MKAIKEELIKGKTYHIYRLEDIVYLRYIFSPKLNNKFNVIPIKIPAGLFVDRDKLNLKCI